MHQCFSSYIFLIPNPDIMFNSNDQQVKKYGTKEYLHIGNSNQKEFD